MIINMILNKLQNAGPAPSPIGQMPPNEMSGGPMPGFFPVSKNCFNENFVFKFFIFFILFFLAVYGSTLSNRSKRTKC